MQVLNYKSSSLYPFLLQHAISIKSLVTLEELAGIVEAFGKLKGDDKAYLLPFLSELELKLKNSKFDLTVYGNLWDALLNFHCTEKDHKIKPLTKLLASMYSESKVTIEPHSLITICLSASRVRRGNIGFWSDFNEINM